MNQPPLTGLESTFGHLLDDTKQVLEHLEKVEGQLQLNAVASGQADGGLALGGRAVPQGGDADSFLNLRSHKATIKEYQDAGGQKRKEMWHEAALRLFSIISERYRPAPSFLSDHSLPPTALALEQVGPQGPAWSEVTKNWPLSAWARTMVRLDNSATGQRGSGTVMGDGRILTANHVIYRPGWLFGEPPVRNAVAKVGFNRVIGGSDFGLTISGFMEPQALDFTWIPVSAQWPRALTGTPFANLPALPWQETELQDSELKGRPVAVIGHPGPASGDDTRLAFQIYRDGPMYMKRFMPGQLHPEIPTAVDENGNLFLRHDCSTVGGASGACLVDLTTGKIIGVHFAGITEGREKDRNRAVPTWLIAAKEPVA